MAIISLEMANIAESAGNGLGYGSLAPRLAARYGLGRAVSILNDVQFTHDPHAPVTVPSRQPARFTTAGQRYDFIGYSRGRHGAADPRDCRPTRTRPTGRC